MVHGLTDFESKNRLSIYGDILLYWFILQGCAKSIDTIAQVVNHSINKFSLILSIYFYRTWCVEKYTGKIICVLFHSLFCVLNFMLPARRPNFARVAHTTWKVEQACCTGIVEGYVGVVLVLVFARGWSQCEAGVWLIPYWIIQDLKKFECS